MLRERGVDIFRMKGVIAIKGCESAPHCSTQRARSTREYPPFPEPQPVPIEPRVLASTQRAEIAHGAHWQPRGASIIGLRDRSLLRV
jgi:hypothetical protein